MNEHILVVPDSPPLFDYLNRHTLVVRTDSIEKARKVYDKVHTQNDIFCLWVHEANALSAIEIEDGMKAVPLSLWVPGMGSFKKVLGKIRLLNDCNVKVFFPGHDEKNLTDIRILSSLGVMCGFYFEDEVKPVNWDLIDDLLFYDVYGRVEHAPIEPFFYAVSHYTVQEPLFFTTPYFDNPTRFLHIDEDFNIALSRRDLVAGTFIGSGAETLDNITENETYKQELKRDTHYFIETRRCPYCPAWRMCRGFYEPSCKKDENCLRFFNDLMEAVGYKQNENKRQRVWQL